VFRLNGFLLSNLHSMSFTSFFRCGPPAQVPFLKDFTVPPYIFSLRDGNGIVCRWAGSFFPTPEFLTFFPSSFLVFGSEVRSMLMDFSPPSVPSPPSIQVPWAHASASCRPSTDEASRRANSRRGFFFLQNPDIFAVFLPFFLPFPEEGTGLQFG